MAGTDSPPSEGPQSEPEGETVRLDINPRLLLENWRGEQDAAALYRSLASREPSEERAGILLEIAEAEDHHAEIMARRLQEMGIPLPKYRISLQVRALGVLGRLFGGSGLARRAGDAPFLAAGLWLRRSPGGPWRYRRLRVFGAIGPFTRRGGCAPRRCPRLRSRTCGGGTSGLRGLRDAAGDLG